MFAIIVIVEVEIAMDTNMATMVKDGIIVMDKVGQM